MIGILWNSNWNNFFNLFWMLEKMNSKGYPFFNSKFTIYSTFNEIFLVESWIVQINNLVSQYEYYTFFMIKRMMRIII